MTVSRNSKPIIVVFRRDLRVADNAALAAAADTGAPVICLFIHDTKTAAARAPGAASRWWLHHSLVALSKELKALGGRLSVVEGRTDLCVSQVLKRSGATAVYCNRLYDPPFASADKLMKEALEAEGIRCRSFDGQLLHEPSLLRTQTGQRYKVYTPFQRALASGPAARDPIDRPDRIEGWRGTIEEIQIENLSLLPVKPDWAQGLRETWTPGERGAQAALAAFLHDRLGDYAESRDFPAEDGTSRLSPHLAFGEITPFQIMAALADKRKLGGNAEKFRKEIAWREFSYHLLAGNPHLSAVNHNRTFDRFPWRSDPEGIRVWQRGATGFPIVDAGMRELWATGWMHNRVRMIVASFLIKHLLADWRSGEAWFWDTLVDADCANNPASWQWVAGSGADASPYFRIFNPVLQGERFDPGGVYVRRHVPELAAMPAKWIHKPWEAPSSVLEAAGVKLGASYPVPVVEHAAARNRAMAAYQSIKGSP